MGTDRCHMGLMRVIGVSWFFVRFQGCFDSWDWLLKLIDRSVRGDVSFSKCSVVQC